MEEEAEDPFSSEMVPNERDVRGEGRWKIEPPLLELLLLFQYRQRELDVFGQEFDSRDAVDDDHAELELMREVESALRASFDPLNFAVVLTVSFLVKPGLRGQKEDLRTILQVNRMLERKQQQEVARYVIVNAGGFMKNFSDHVCCLSAYITKNRGASR